MFEWFENFWCSFLDFCYGSGRKNGKIESKPLIDLNDDSGFIGYHNMESENQKEGGM